MNYPIGRLQWFRFLPLILAGILLSCNASETPETSQPPNILLIISDDQAWNDYGFTGHEHIETPHLDRLAEESLTFTRGYVTAPLCCPSLASIITGLYPHQHGVTGNDPLFDFEGKRYSQEWNEDRHARFSQVVQQFKSHPLLTKRLEELNYLSLQSGKWWMGSYEDGYFSQGMTHGDPARGGRHGDEGLTIGREGLEPIYNFIEEADSLDRPFFVWYAPFLPHAPHTPPQELEEKYLALAPTPAIARYWAMCEWFDQTCGDLIDHLEEKQITEETLVIYVCDNGWIQEPDKPNRYAPRSKRSPYEGGIRTPLMFKWPGKIEARMDTTTLASSIDIVPTVLAACDLAPDEKLPGVNVMDRAALTQRRAIFAEAYEHDIQNLDQPTQSLQYRIGIDYPWKLLLPDTRNVPDQSIELFDLSRDPFERKNLAEEKPEEVTRLKDAVDAWWTPPVKADR